MAEWPAGIKQLAQASDTPPGWSDDGSRTSGLWRAPWVAFCGPVALLYALAAFGNGSFARLGAWLAANHAPPSRCLVAGAGPHGVPRRGDRPAPCTGVNRQTSPWGSVVLGVLRVKSCPCHASARTTLSARIAARMRHPDGDNSQPVGFPTTTGTGNQACLKWHPRASGTFAVRARQPDDSGMAQTRMAGLHDLLYTVPRRLSV